jgi:hypothetical protein
VAGRPVRAGLLALALHGVVLGLASALIGGRPAAQVPAPATAQISVETPVEVEIVEPPVRVPPSAAASTASRTPAASDAAAGARAPEHRSREGVRRSLTRAPATVDPWADLQVSYDAPTGPAVGDPAGTGGDGLGAALAGIGLGAGGDGLLPGGVKPPPPPESHAAPPRPRHYYTRWRFQGARRVWGMAARAVLSIDTRGRVKDVRITEHVNPWIDQQAIDLAHTFVFYPALDDAGEPIAGTYVWTFVVTD